MSDFKLLMLGAMYENGGNTTHRFLDGHPQLYVYPFESQPGSRHVQDGFTSMFPVKYRWPEFLLDATPAQDYHAIIDEEGKVRSRTPHVSKFRHEPFDMNDDERRDIYLSIIEKTGRSRANNVAAFFEATHKAWKDNVQTGEEEFYVGYSPIIVIDAEKILSDMPNAHFLHVVRNPWSAYADTKKRPVPLPLREYILRWNVNQNAALAAKRAFPERMHIVRAEDVMADSVGTLTTQVLEPMGLRSADSLAVPSWNSKELTEVYPWGTIRTATPEANLATANELSDDEQTQVRNIAHDLLAPLGYESFLEDGQASEPVALTV
ncbi:sulfotransferase [Solirubrobacter sp. CPCC 204708]|uniref:Sulfotransferase n=1 Tax=Solirubrobacter deserti TaxID=2282478 RepID=A0ABT4RN82_9ACTN|nr:sulfotransferase [Solirubrobacter deserti]MBE2317427.1 sulfotransferase [Solirubrobacter deserti]MDA0140009.1 sulfotransferase [Solirubrobacter deserti]